MLQICTFYKLFIKHVIKEYKESKVNQSCIEGINVQFIGVSLT